MVAGYLGSLAIMVRAALAAILVSVPAFAQEICAVVIPDSVVDRAFISSMDASPIKHSRPKREWVCFDNADKAAVAALRAQAQSDNPQSCVTFANLSRLEATESKLHSLALANWRDKPSTLCYLIKDKKAVENALR